MIDSAGFPVTIEMVSRFRTKQETKTILDDLAVGKVDVIVGTHRLLSADASRISASLSTRSSGSASRTRNASSRCARVDVLTMTATPIPRTLNMSLVGIRDMSVIETPPRIAVDSDERRQVRRAGHRAGDSERTGRGGQVLRPQSRGVDLLDWQPAAAAGAGGEDRRRPRTDGRRRARTRDARLCRAPLRCCWRLTIVENGLDIPNANTIIINRADRYGLAQLYQLRGRVGRSDRPAYAYLLIPPQEALSGRASDWRRSRSSATWAAAFAWRRSTSRFAAPGNLLGGEQSGHIDAVGFEMYTKLLEETIRELRGEEIEDDARATVNLRVDLKIDEDYIQDMNQRLMVYRKVASARTARSSTRPWRASAIAMVRLRARS